jgi:hypothetical protein
VGGQPQLEVLDPIVGAIPVAMMDHFVGEKGATQVPRHDKSVLSNRGRASDQISKLWRDRDVQVTMAL